jgi:hypothetical protein
MCRTRILIRTGLTRASRWVLAVVAGLILGVIEPEGALYGVSAQSRSTDVFSQALSGCEERAYRSHMSSRLGEMIESGLKGKSELISQRRSVAWTAQ